MIEFLINILMIFLVLFVIIMFLCACIIGVGVMDWFLDSDIKGWLIKHLGDRKIFKKISKGLEKVEENLEKQVKDTYVTKDETIKQVFYPDNVQSYIMKEPSNITQQEKDIKGE